MKNLDLRKFYRQECRPDQLYLKVGKQDNMRIYNDKRACERRRHKATIEFSYFNRKQCYEAQTVNHGDEGMCFKSEVSLKPGTTVSVRVKSLHPNGICSGNCRGLRLITLAEAKWCKEISSETKPVYEIGAKYFQPAY